MKKTLLVISMLVASHSIHSLKADEQWAQDADEQWAQDMEQWIAGAHNITQKEKDRLQTLKSKYGRIEGLRKWQKNMFTKDMKRRRG